MNQQQPPNFNDPNFRAAMRQALGQETAPGSLKQRISGALASEAAAATPLLKPAVAGRIGRTFAMRIAASIVALTGLGILVYQLRDEFWPQRMAQVGPALPASFLQDMVNRHDAAVAGLATNPSPAGDLAAIGTNLSAKLGKPVAAVALGDQWTLKSADIGAVGEIQAAQLLFVRGQTTVSLLSVSSIPAYTPVDGTRYDNELSDHLISGVVKNGVAYCLIAQSKDHSLKAAELRSLREKVASLMGLPPASSCGASEDQTASATAMRS